MTEDTKLSAGLRLRRELDEVTRDRDEWEARYRLADREAKELAAKLDRLLVDAFATEAPTTRPNGKRRHLDNVELLTAAACLDLLADCHAAEGDFEGADAVRDTAETMRHIAELSISEGRPVHRGLLEIPHPTITVEVVATYGR